MEVVPKKFRQFMPFSLEDKPSGLPPQDLDTQKIHVLNAVLLYN